ncbi:MAG TPA: PP0621 family protein [Rhodocyclaceae bacterium]|nr:PP0621 family protein [Rhodocyclaceae bacterium]
MTKLIVFVLLGIVLYKLLAGRRRDDAGRKTPQGNRGEAMVSCDFCGLHVPESESVIADGRHYCGEEHRRLGSGAQRD